MDFGDIIIVLVYIMIPLLISSKRRAERKGKTSDKRPGRPQGRVTGKGLMDRLEQMVAEMEKKASEANAKRPAGKGPAPAESRPKAQPPAGISDDRTVDWQQVYTPSQSVLQEVDIQELYTGKTDQEPETDKRLRDKAVGKTVEKMPGEIGDVEEQNEKKGFFNKDDIVKGIILSEILQPPRALRRNRRHPV